MTLSQPYFRIARPDPNGRYISNINNSYILDGRYCAERGNLTGALHQIIQDLIRIFDYVSPQHGNLGAFSHRIYEIILRASTEFESNAKGILSANDYLKQDYNIRDYYLLAQACKLHEYEIILDGFGNGSVMKPFDSWRSTAYTPLSWYQDYNKVKHNRHVNFHLATLNNAILATAAVQIILFAQFNVAALNRYRIAGMYQDDDDGFESTDDNPFKVKSPTTWTNSECYDFDWNALKNSQNPCQKFTF